MDIEFRAFATFRQTVGQKSIVREYDDIATVGDALHALTEEFPDLDVFDDDGNPREFASILKDGRDITHLQGLDTELEDGDTVSLFPPVAGGGSPASGNGLQPTLSGTPSTSTLAGRAINSSR